MGPYPHNSSRCHIAEAHVASKPLQHNEHMLQGLKTKVLACRTNFRRTTWRTWRNITLSEIAKEEIRRIAPQGVKQRKNTFLHQTISFSLDFLARRDFVRHVKFL